MNLFPSQGTTAFPDSKKHYEISMFQKETNGISGSSLDAKLTKQKGWGLVSLFSFGGFWPMKTLAFAKLFISETLKKIDF